MADPTSRVARFRILMPVEPGEVSRVAKGADCKSAASWLRRFESFLPHQPSLASRATAGQASTTLSRAKRAKAVSLKPEGRRRTGADVRELRLGKPAQPFPERSERRLSRRSPLGEGGPARMFATAHIVETRRAVK